MLSRSILTTALFAAIQAPTCGRLGSSPAETPHPSSPRSTTMDGGVAASEDFDHDHRLWSELLSTHVKGDAFDYASLKKDPKKLDDYLSRLHAVTPEQLKTWTKDQRFAFWVNVYNAHTIKKIVDNYPVKSIRKLSGAFGLNSVFDNRFIAMEALNPSGKRKKLSLNDVEHGILRERFKDARLHAAVNCASHSCPPLRNEAFTAAKLDTQLDEQMRRFVNDPERNVIDTRNRTLRISKIFDWFESDFERDAKSVKEYFIRYAPEDRAEAIRGMRVKYLDYDWSLNDVQPTD